MDDTKEVGGTRERRGAQLEATRRGVHIAYLERDHIPRVSWTLLIPEAKRWFSNHASGREVLADDFLGMDATRRAASPPRRGDALKKKYNLPPDATICNDRCAKCGCPSWYVGERMGGPSSATRRRPHYVCPGGCKKLMEEPGKLTLTEKKPPQPRPPPSDAQPLAAATHWRGGRRGGGRRGGGQRSGSLVGPLRSFAPGACRSTLLLRTAISAKLKLLCTIAQRLPGRGPDGHQHTKASLAAGRGFSADSIDGELIAFAFGAFAFPFFRVRWWGRVFRAYYSCLSVVPN